MILGHVRDKLPWVALSFTGKEETIQVEFLVDTGYDGAIALPSRVLSLLDATFLGDRTVLLADRTPRDGPYFAVTAIWEGEPRILEATLVEGRPLLGYEAMERGTLTIEMRDGGEVVIEE